MRAGEHSTTWIRSGCCVVSATEHNCFGDRTRLLNRLRMFKMRRVKNKHRPKTERHGSPPSEPVGLLWGLPNFTFPRVSRRRMPRAPAGIAKVRFFLVIAAF